MKYQLAEYCPLKLTMDIQRPALDRLYYKSVWKKIVEWFKKYW